MQASNQRCRVAIVLAVLVFLLTALRIFNLAESAFFVFAAAGGLLILLASSPKWPELLLAPLIAIFLAAAYLALGGRFGNFLGARPEDALAFVGIAALLLLGWRAVRGAEAMKDFVAASILPVFCAITVLALRASMRLHQPVYDLYLYRFDGSLGIEASSLIARYFNAVPLARDVCTVAYQAMPLMQLILIALLLKKHGKFPVFAVMVIGLAGLVAALLYQLLPGVGPLYIFGPHFPYQQHPIAALSTTVPIRPAPPNAMPSLHFAWALLILWNIPRRNRAGVVAAQAFLALITLATLGLGEHYLVDLVVAIPFAICVQSTCLGRWKPALFTGGITLAWIGYLRFLMPSLEPKPEFAWAAAIITVSLPFFCTLGRDKETVQEHSVSTQQFALARSPD